MAPMRVTGLGSLTEEAQDWVERLAGQAFADVVNGLLFNVRQQIECPTTWLLMPEAHIGVAGPLEAHHHRWAQW